MSLDLLSNLFAVCFWFGTAASVVSFIFGVGHHGSLHLPHFGHATVVPGSTGHAGSAGLSPFNLTSILAFLVIFGAVGLALQGGLGGIVVLGLAVVAGVVAGWLAFMFIARFLMRGETFLSDEPIVGTVGTINIPIGSGRVGEIMYIRRGVRRSDGARSIDGRAIEAGQQVVIVSYDSGLATVQRWSEFLDGSTLRREALNRVDAPASEPKSEQGTDETKDSRRSPPSPSAESSTRGATPLDSGAEVPRERMDPP